MSDQRKRGTIYCKQRAPITFKSTSEHVDDARETDSFMCSAITKRSCKRGHTRSVGARDTVRAVRGRRAWSCEAHLRTYAPSLASICFRQRVARSSLLDDPLKWRSAARYTCATFLGLFSRICTVGGYEVGIAQECLEYSWQTFTEVGKRIDAIAAGMWELDFVPLTPDGQRFVSFYLKNCRDWMILAESCYKTGVTVVPMYDTLGPDVVGFIQRQTGTATVLVTQDELRKLLKENPFVNVIVTGPIESSLQQECRAAGLVFHTISEVEAKGRESLGRSVPWSSPTREDLALLCYTSGTTGDPKGGSDAVAWQCDLRN